MSIFKGYGEYPCAIKKSARDMPEKGTRKNGQVYS
jgi:hypothetical protein